jgi:hypothetical protein
MKRPVSHASFDQVLFHMDAPEVVVLSFGDKSKVVAVATGNISTTNFFGARVSIRQFSEYLNNRFDLRYLLGNADREAWYTFDLPDNDFDEVELKPAELTGFVIENILPESGFFARDHTEEYSSIIIEDQAVQRFDVDGNWDMKEFSKFHAQVSDLYALTRSIDIFVDDNVALDRRREVMDSFVKPWRGGGSYYGFFRSLAATGGREYKPDIKAIQWASPGYIDIEGDQDSFSRLLNLLKHFAGARDKANEDYEHLWSYLQEMKLLNSSSARLDKKSATAVEVGERAKALSRTLGVTSYRNLKKMAGNDPVVAAKVLLAAKRRVNRLYDFFAEGRVSVPGVSIR